jgi:membrane complex biogenesis BtpA family protein
MNTQKFKDLFPEKKPLIAMIHVPALPGTPNNKLEISKITQQVCREAEVLIHGGVHAIMIENMHDVPYLNRSVGPEITSTMTHIATELRSMTELPLGIQILAGANREALAVALAADMQFIRAEGFVFAHIADEGLMDSNAGDLLRYRKQIGAEHIHIFTDVKKKHSSHSITQDISLPETIHAAQFFLSDGVIITGSKTGASVDQEDLARAYEVSELPVLVGSGVTPEGLSSIINLADAFIVGSYLKKDGKWKNPPDVERLSALSTERQKLLS